MVGNDFLFNSHNFRVWSEENPHATRTRAAQERFSVNVRAAYRHSILEQSTIVTLEGSDWTNESDVTLLHIASTLKESVRAWSEVNKQAKHSYVRFACPIRALQSYNGALLEYSVPICVRAGIGGDHLVGPYLLPERLTGANYLVFLQQVLPKLLDDEDVSAAMRSSMWFQHDGAPAHYSIHVRLQLNATYGQQWIGPVLWPARSTDLTCLDYFLWGYVKSLVYETPVNSAEDLVARIAAAAGEVRDTPGVFANV
ncbi:hypothetical protein AVEN_268492-1 [Araneus ventricosus]|uniref:Transposable element Tc3 transposase n=1 Tax=Araneus ventricosus TaxID=182803 RepID=A0A4Y2TZ74_ARAVE|nr:hypothetical protein AVEN_268492-1 [Araneus ventricosus]